MLRKNISGLYCIVEDMEFYEPSAQDEEVADYCDLESAVEVTVTGEGRATRASLGPFSVLYSDILKKAPGHGLDATEAAEELKDDETTLMTCAADVF